MTFYSNVTQSYLLHEAKNDDDKNDLKGLEGLARLLQ